MALIVNKLVIDPDLGKKQEAPVEPINTVSQAPTKIGNITAGRIVNVRQNNIDAIVASKRPLIYDIGVEITTTPPAPIEIKPVTTEIKVRHRDNHRSRYMTDMLTVEK